MLEKISYIPMLKIDTKMIQKFWNFQTNGDKKKSEIIHYLPRKHQNRQSEKWKISRFFWSGWKMGKFCFALEKWGSAPEGKIWISYIFMSIGK